MRIRIITPGGFCPRGGDMLPLGAVADLDESLATYLVQYGLAAYEPAAVETTATAPAEDTARRTGKTQPRKVSRNGR